MENRAPAGKGGSKTRYLVGLLAVVLIAQIGYLIVVLSRKQAPAPVELPVAQQSPATLPPAQGMPPGGSPMMGVPPPGGSPMPGGPPGPPGQPAGAGGPGGPQGRVPLDVLAIGVMNLKDSSHPLTEAQKKKLQPIVKRMEDNWFAMMREQQALYAVLDAEQQQQVMQTQRPGDPSKLQLPMSDTGLDPFINVLEQTVEK